MHQAAVTVFGALALLVAACGGGGSDASDVDDGLSESKDNPLAEAFGGGGGGSLTFDGEEIEISSVVCVLGDDTFDVGTVSDNGFRVLVGLNNPLNSVSAQILDAEFVQWFPQGDDIVERDGGTFRSDPTTYFNNRDDKVVTASFTVECP